MIIIMILLFQDVIEKMSSIKVSVTVPSVRKYMHRLDPNITRYQENLLVRKILIFQNKDIYIYYLYERQQQCNFGNTDSL